MAQSQVMLVSDTFTLSKKTTVGHTIGHVQFIIYATQQPDLQPTTVSYTNSVWRKIKYQMSKASQLLKERKEGKIHLVGQKYLEVKQKTNGGWEVNIMTFGRSGNTIYQASVWLTEEEWLRLVDLEAKITEYMEHIEGLHQEYKKQQKGESEEPPSKKKKSDSSSKMGVLYSWTLGETKGKEKFFSREHALKNCRAQFPDLSAEQVAEQIVISKELVTPPSVTQFLTFALCYGKKAKADFLYQYDNPLEQSYETILDQRSQMPVEWLVTAFVQFHQYLGIVTAQSKAEPHIEAVEALMTDELVKKGVQDLDMKGNSAYHYLCHDIIDPFLPTITVD